MKIEKESVIKALKIVLLVLFFTLLWGNMLVKAMAAVRLYNGDTFTIRQGAGEDVEIAIPTSAVFDTYPQYSGSAVGWIIGGNDCINDGENRGHFSVGINAENVAPGTYSLNLHYDPANTVTITIIVTSPAPAPAKVEEPQNVPAPEPCNHTYEWEIVRQATETEDGEGVFKCTKCGDVLRKEAIGGMFIFFDNVVKKIRNAPYGGSVDVETYRWLSFSEYVLDEWAKRQDITLNLKFREKGYLGGNIIKVTIPAGANISALKDENGYCGFANLVKHFGISQ